LDYQLHINFNMKITILIIVFFLSLIAESQTITISDKAIGEKTDNCIFLGQSADRIFLLFEKYHFLSSSNPITASVIIIDSNLRLITKNKINTNYKDKNLRLIKVLKHHSKLYVFAAFYNEKLQQDFLFVKEINLSDNSVGEWKMIVGSPAETKPEANNYLQKSNYLIEWSPDKTKFAVYSQELYLKAANKTFFSVHVYNDVLEEIYTVRNSIEGKLKIGLDCKLLVNNKGDFMTSMVRINKTIKEYYFKYYSKDFFIFGAKTSSSDSFLKKVSIPDKTISSLVISSDENGDFYLGGYYSNIGFASIKGSFILQLRKDSLVIKRMENFAIGVIKSNPMPSTIYSHYPNEMIRYHANSLYINNSGDYLLLGELIHQHDSYFNTNEKAMYYDSPAMISYDFMDILIEKGKFSGEYFWRILPKSQVYPLHPLVSYSSYYDFKKLILIYNQRNNLPLWGKPKGVSIITVFDDKIDKISENQTKGILYANSQIYFPERISFPWYSLIRRNKNSYLIKIVKE